VDGGKKRNGTILMKVEDIINRDSLRERLEGDFDLFVELAELFAKESSNLLAAVEDAVKNKNGEKIGKSAHTIKGAISNFSADKAYQAALTLERIGKDGDLEKSDEALESLKKEIDRMKAALSLMIADEHL
jgi:two-component system sensor histidine kinase/response regulator